MKKNKEFKWPCKEGKELVKVFLKLNKSEDIEKVLRDICTLSELQAMTERWQVARLLSEEASYRKITEKTGVSTTTVARVAHWIQNGAGGYSIALQQNDKL